MAKMDEADRREIERILAHWHRLRDAVRAYRGTHEAYDRAVEQDAATLDEEAALFGEITAARARLFDILAEEEGHPE
jgi:hypothetical protein